MSLTSVATFATSISSASALLGAIGRTASISIDHRRVTPRRRRVSESSRVRSSAARGTPATRDPAHAQHCRSQQAELAQQPDSVRVAPVLGDLAVRQVADGDAPHRDAPTTAGAAHDPSRGDRVALRHLVLPLDGEIRECPPIELDGLARSVESVERGVVDMVDEVLTVEIADALKLAPAADLLEREPRVRAAAFRLLCRTDGIDDGAHVCLLPSFELLSTRPSPQNR